MSVPNGKAPTLVKGQAPNGAKKLVIKPLKLKPQLPENFEALTWAKLQDAVHAVLEKRPVASSLEELYRAVEDMCIHKMADSLYTKLQSACDVHIGQQLVKLKENSWLDPVVFLERMDAVWLDHCSAMLLLRCIFLYLDRTHVITSANVRSLFDMGLQLFRTHLCRHEEVEMQCVQGLQVLIERERMGDSVDRQRLKSLLRMLSSLGLYADSFQRPFLERTSQFYRAEGERCMQDMEVPDYLLRCEARLAEEFERSHQYLDIATRKPLIQAVEKQLLARHMAAVLERGFAALMDGVRVDALARLYGLCSRVLALDALKVSWKDYIRTTGTKLVKDEEKDKEMVDRLLDLKGRLDDILTNAFQSNEHFANALKEAFENFINSRSNKPAELIAKFIDTKLRTGNKGQSEEELEGQLEQALLLFRYISGKDVFEAFYKKDLAKRLLLGKSASIDAEKSMIAKLKAECGAQFTTKLEGMFKDVELSGDMMLHFRQSSMARERIPGGIEMAISVLTLGFWPTYPTVDVKLPEELANLAHVFSDYYLQKQTGRKLVWHHSLGSCILKAAFPKGMKELSVSLFQAVILMLFNGVESMTLEEIREATGIEDKELRRNLQSLACAKVRVLTKEPKGRDVEDHDVFHFNSAFTERLYRIKINTIQLKETEEENKKTNEEVLVDRRYQVDAAIVRIMKTRKTLSHKLLMQETIQQLKFPIKGADIKKCIEGLIEREYLARDKDDSNVYTYLA